MNRKTLRRLEEFRYQISRTTQMRKLEKSKKYLETDTTLLICRTICTYVEAYHKCFLWNRQAPYVVVITHRGIRRVVKYRRHRIRPLLLESSDRYLRKGFNICKALRPWPSVNISQTLGRANPPPKKKSAPDRSPARCSDS